MLKLGVTGESSSPWRSPPVLVPKPNGSVQFCVDYRHLNEVTSFDAYPMPRIDALLDKIGDTPILSTLNLTKG